MPHAFTTIYCTSCGQQHDVPLRCADRFCPVCGKSRVLEARRRLKEIIEQVPLDQTLRLKHIVLTLPSMADPGAMTAHLVSSFRRLRKEPFWLNRVQGGCFFLEFKRSEKGWHVHLHIIAASSFMPHALLRARWHAITNAQVVWISNCSATNAVNYLITYCTKEPPLGADKELVNRALKHHRLFNKFGMWTKLRVSIKKYLFPCPHCGKSDWISEFIIRRASRTG